MYVLRIRGSPPGRPTCCQISAAHCMFRPTLPQPIPTPYLLSPPTRTRTPEADTHVRVRAQKQIRTNAHTHLHTCMHTFTLTHAHLHTHKNEQCLITVSWSGSSRASLPLTCRCTPCGDHMPMFVSLACCGIRRTRYAMLTQSQHAQSAISECRCPLWLPADHPLTPYTATARSLRVALRWTGP